MNCEGARDHIILAAYGELPDEEAIGLELHLASCQECLQELNTLREMDSLMALNPVMEPDPNFLAQSRMKLDEALDAIPQGSAWMVFRANAGAWWGHLSGAPALATLLVGVGFIGGHLTHRYQVDHAAKVPFPMVLTDTTGGGIRTVTGVQSLPGDMVQVSFERMVPEMAQGSLDDPQIKKLLMVGTMAAATPVVRLDSVVLLADQCKTGHACRSEDDGDVRKTLLTALRTDKSPVVRMKVLEGLQPYVSQDERVRDAVSQALLTDASLAVRTKAVAVLQPVQSDSSVRQALRTVSTTDVNPYLRTVSMQALGDSASLQ
ncbi:HEAT repeat domain-containing protein [Granulicella tundricola]|uniref:Putative zinc-finger domain-containing protein n=1 Tax=Granulicella tundricola (strain ATCC BAA-1859 / DSM 23138 / MP5ACTX9) TaxID=1198114 RepID=E8WWV4_GRATM|nr:HEAT repeat domain-containing protein [Granulicella tundricola]ADW67432.1 hypothetical protein AciX9_0360 [Granulicella tundricola MP5ACTX9]